MSSYPLISVLVPVYKPPLQYLKKCCEGIFNQTYPNLEVLFYIDGTADECPEMVSYLRSIEDEHDNVRIYTGIKNMGVSYARNYLKSQMSNEAYAYVYNDSDDEMDITNILRRYQLMKEKDLDGVFTEFTSKRFNAVDDKAIFWQFIQPSMDKFKDSLIFGCAWWGTFGANSMLRNNEKTRQIDFRTELKFAEDLQYALDLIWKANIKFDIIHEMLYNQYLILKNPNSLTGMETNTSTKLVIDGVEFPFCYTCYKNFWEEHGFTFNAVTATIYAKIFNYIINDAPVLQFDKDENKMLNKMISVISKMTGKPIRYYFDLIMTSNQATRAKSF